MVYSKYKKLRLTILFLGICSLSILSGQSTINYEFIFKVFKSINHHDRYQSTQDTIFETYLTFHPVSISNDTVELYLSSIFIDDNGEKAIESGRIVRVPKKILPGETLQFLLLPLVVYLNNTRARQKDYDFYRRFSEKELAAWKACGYQVCEPMKIGINLQYR